MAHATTVSDLVDGLIHSITGVKKNDSQAKQFKAVVAKGVRDHSHARTNQFDVKAKLDGLIEKFAVQNREDLSDALQARLEELPLQEKWLPENLSLLLLLSDRPVLNTDLAALKALNPETPAEEQLTWDEIVAENPLDEEGLWDDIDRGYHSSGDEEYADADAESERTTSTGATSVSEDAVEGLARLHLISPDATQLGVLESTRPKLPESHAVVDELPLSSLLIIRDSLAMLRGWSSEIYSVDRESRRVFARSSFRMTNVNIATIGYVLTAFAKQGSALQSLRRWVRSRQSQPWQHTCQASIAQLLRAYSAELALMEQKFVGPSARAAVSVAEVLDETRALSRYLVRIATILADAEKSTTLSPFALMDGLYEEACTARMAGDDDGLLMINDILSDSIQTYLRDIMAWITSGAPPSSEEHSLVVATADQYIMGTLWHARYSLRKLDSGMPSTPSFLAHKSDTIFAMGKARMFLTHLSMNTQGADERSGELLAGPDFAKLRERLQEEPLMPYEDVLDNTLTAWIERIDTDCTPSLKQALIHDHGLLNSIMAMEQVYLGAGGAQLEEFALSLFERIDRGSRVWRDDFLLTDLARETLGGRQCVEAESLSVVFEPGYKGLDSVVLSLQGVYIYYRFAWPIENITRESTPQIHAQAFIFLLQVQRAHYLMRKQSFALRHLPVASNFGHLSSSIRLRHALISFNTTMHAHITTAGRVLGEELRAKMLQANDVDAMVAVYAAHKKRLENALLLAPKMRPIRDAVTSVLELVERIAMGWEYATSAKGRDPESTRMPSEAVRQMHKELESSLAFITAGVRGVSRAGGEVLLEALAERLEWMVT